MIIFTILCIGRDYKGQGAKLKCHRIQRMKYATSLHILAPYKRQISHSCTYCRRHIHTIVINIHVHHKITLVIKILSYSGQFFTSYVSQNFTPKIFLQAVVCTAFYGAPDAILVSHSASVTQSTAAQIFSNYLGGEGNTTH